MKLTTMLNSLQLVWPSHHWPRNRLHRTRYLIPGTECV